MVYVCSILLHSRWKAFYGRRSQDTHKHKLLDAFIDRTNGMDMDIEKYSNSPGASSHPICLNHVASPTMNAIYLFVAASPVNKLRYLQSQPSQLGSTATGAMQLIYASLRLEFRKCSSLHLAILFRVISDPQDEVHHDGQQQDDS